MNHAKCPLEVGAVSGQWRTLIALLFTIYYYRVLGNTKWVMILILCPSFVGEKFVYSSIR